MNEDCWLRASGTVWAATSLCAPVGNIRQAAGGFKCCVPLLKQGGQEAAAEEESSPSGCGSGALQGGRMPRSLLCPGEPLTAVEGKKNSHGSTDSPAEGEPAVCSVSCSKRAEF